MPHQCTGCGYTFEDGSKEMLSGCPECGGNKFQFYPPGTEIPDGPPSETPPEPASTDGSSVAESVGRATTKVRSFVSSNSNSSDSKSSESSPSPPDSDSGLSDSDSGLSDLESGLSDSDSGLSDSDPDSSDSDPDSSNSEESVVDGSAVEGSNASSNRPASRSTERSIHTGHPPDPNAAWPDEKRGGGRSSTTADDIIDADARRESAESIDSEDVAQASARSDVVSPAELTDTDARTRDIGSDTDTQTGAANQDPLDADTPASSDGRVVSEPTGDDPDLSELRAQLNDQFESIKIVEPGQYELNLMELYNREEYIIALQENGRYVIQVPDNWLGDNPGDR